MKRSSYTTAGIAAALLLTLFLSLAAAPSVVLAQEPAGETPTIEPTAPVTVTPVETATATATPAIATATAIVTPIATVTPVPSGPVTIPEPLTVVLFGTGLAALSAAVASRRGKNGK
jgi:hypothetical protein